MPLASLARLFAVAGATQATVAHFGQSMWAIASSKVEVRTGLPVRPAKVTGPTKRVALSLITTRTSQPAFVASEVSSQAL